MRDPLFGARVIIIATLRSRGVSLSIPSSLILNPVFAVSYHLPGTTAAAAAAPPHLSCVSIVRCSRGKKWSAAPAAAQDFDDGRKRTRKSLNYHHHGTTTTGPLVLPFCLPIPPAASSTYLSYLRLHGILDVVVNSAAAAASASSETG